MTPNDSPAPQGQDLLIATMTTAGRSAAFIASELSISSSTVARARARHRDWISQARSTRAEEISSALLTATDSALTRLIALVNSPNDPVALGASKFIIDSARSWHHEVDLEERIEEIEARLARGF
jgi:hypothetical protein